MKKKWLWLLLIVFAGLLGTAFYLLRYPQNYFRSRWVENFLRKKEFSKNWKWEELRFALRSDRFLEYQVRVNARALSIDTQLETIRASGLLQELKSDYLVKIGLSGLRFRALAPLLLKIDTLEVSLSKKEEPVKKEIKPFAWKDYLSRLHSSIVPNFNVSAKRISLSNLVDGKSTPILSLSDLVILSDPNSLKISTRARFSPILGETPIEIQLKPESLELKTTITGIPYSGPLSCHLSVHDFKPVDKPSRMHGQCLGQLATKPLFAGTVIRLPAELDFSGLLTPDLKLKKLNLALISKKREAKTELDFSFEGDLFTLLQNQDQILKELLARSDLNLKIPDLNAFLATFPAGFRLTPAPLNSMNGPVELKVKAEKNGGSTTQVNLAIDLTEPRQQQRFKMEIAAKLPWIFTPGTMVPKLDTPEINLTFQKLVLVLPRVKLTEPMPGLFRDSRIKTSKVATTKNPMEWNLDLATDQPIVLRTSFLKGTLFKIKMKFELNNEGMRTGHLELLPVETAILKRPIVVKKLNLDWPEYGKGLVDGLLLFKLPEYKISLKLAGPINSPRTALESSPPLSANDIYSVLLFGRPMSELDPEGREAMARVKHGLTQGLFSLSTLYLLSGTPIESIGYDADTGDVSASIRLSKRNSLRVGTEAGGLGTVAVRRSLGKGWYIESQAQEANKDSTTGNTNFGLMLQRVIAY